MLRQERLGLPQMIWYDHLSPYGWRCQVECGGRHMSMLGKYCRQTSDAKQTGNPRWMCTLCFVCLGVVVVIGKSLCYF